MTRDEFIVQLIACRPEVVKYGMAVFPGCFSEDAVSEAFTVAIEKWQMYDESCKISSFVIGIYRHKQLQEYELNKKFIHHIHKFGDCNQVHTFDLEYIESKIDKLTPCQRETIERIIAGMKPREVAKLSHKSADYVKTYNNIVRNKLRKLINDESLLENYQPNAALAHHKQHTHPAA